MTERSLPSSLRKKADVIGTLAKKISLHKAVHNKSGRKKSGLCEIEEEWIENFLERSDITYTAPGRRNTVYVGMHGVKSEYKQKRYLLLKLRDLEINVSKIITNENFPSLTEAFGHELSVRQTYNFLKMHKEVALKSSDILLPAAHDLVEIRTCDLSSKDCMLGNDLAKISITVISESSDHF